MICIERKPYAFGGHKCLRDGRPCGLWHAFWCGMGDSLRAAWRSVWK